MARKYRRKSNGQFAGGAGQNNGSSANSGSKGVKAARPKATVGARFKKGAQASAKFAAKNPRLVLGAVATATFAAQIHADNRSASKRLKAGRLNTARKQDFIASKRGLGQHRPGSGLKVAKRTLRGAYKIASK